MPLPEALAPLYWFFLLMSFVFGSVIGSFCNVCISRWPAGESVVRPRSRCPKCRAEIAWYDNFPILSWLILRAKCRHCGQPISWQYPLVEGITGALFAAVYWRFGYSPATPVYMALCAGLVIVVFQDLADWTIPDEVTLPGIVLGLAAAAACWRYPEAGLRIGHPLAALDGVALGAFVICMMDGIAVLLLRKPGMGFGDVKLLAMLGAFLGWRGVLGTIMMGSVLGSVAGLGMVLFFQFRGGAEDGTEDDGATEEEDSLYPIDPLASVVLAVCGGYLLARVALYLPAAQLGVFEPARGMILGTVAVVVLLAWAVAAASLWIYRRQGPMPAEEEEAEAEEAISLENHYLPFGPYLAAGGALFLFFGPEVLAAYVASMI